MIRSPGAAAQVAGRPGPEEDLPGSEGGRGSPAGQLQRAEGRRGARVEGGDGRVGDLAGRPAGRVPADGGGEVGGDGRDGRAERPRGLPRRALHLRVEDEGVLLHLEEPPVRPLPDADPQVLQSGGVAEGAGQDLLRGRPLPPRTLAHEEGVGLPGEEEDAGQLSPLDDHVPGRPLVPREREAAWPPLREDRGDLEADRAVGVVAPPREDLLGDGRARRQPQDEGSARRETQVGRKSAGDERFPVVGGRSPLAAQEGQPRAVQAEDHHASRPRAGARGPGRLRAPPEDEGRRRLEEPPGEPRPQGLPDPVGERALGEEGVVDAAEARHRQAAEASPHRVPHHQRARQDRTGGGGPQGRAQVAPAVVDEPPREELPGTQAFHRGMIVRRCDQGLKWSLVVRGSRWLGRLPLRWSSHSEAIQEEGGRHGGVPPSLPGSVPSWSC